MSEISKKLLQNSQIIGPSIFSQDFMHAVIWTIDAFGVFEEAVK